MPTVIDRVGLVHSLLPSGLRPARPVSPVAPTDPGDRLSLAHPAGSALAKANGREIMLGGRPFRFVGINVYDLASVAERDPGELDRTLQAIAWSGATVVRFWAFSDHESQVFERVFAANKRLGLGLKFIPVLGNQWDFSPEAKNKTPEWYRHGYLADYRPHVEQTVSRFAREGDILMWELMNEPLSDDGDALFRFVADTSALIKQKTQHLVSVGTLSADQPGLAHGGFRRLHSLPTVDVVTFHDYAYDRGKSPEESVRWLERSDRLMDEIVKVARDLNKPLFMGEIGIKVSHGYQADPLRDPAAAMDMAQRRIAFAFDKGAIGALTWGPQPLGHGVDGHGYGFTFTPDSAAGQAVRRVMTSRYPHTR